MSARLASTYGLTALAGLWSMACDIPEPTSDPDASLSEPDAGGGDGRADGIRDTGGGRRDGEPLGDDALPDDAGIYTVAAGYCYPPCVEALRARCAFAESEPFVCSVYDDESVSCYRDGIRVRNFTETINGHRANTNVRTLHDGRTICFSQSTIEGHTPPFIVRDDQGNIVAEDEFPVVRDGMLVQVTRCNASGRRYYRANLDPDREYCRTGRPVVAPGGCQPGACEWLGPR